jgi:DNA-directed RNA polymerase specialized sigma24 family protein
VNNRFDQLAETFQLYLNGDDDALIAITESERRYLFDYLLRMTGQVSRSKESIDEAIRAVSATAANFTSLRSLIAKLYNTSRNFIADIWNADTAELVNRGFEFDEEQNLPAGEELQKLIRVDRCLQQMPGTDREVIILRGIAGFSDIELAGLFNVDVKLVRDKLTSASTKLAERAGIEPDHIWNQVEKLPLHPIPDISKQSTLALSQMIGEVDRTNKGFPSARRWIIVAALVLGLMIWAYLNGWFG